VTMRKTVLALMAAVALAACGGEDPEQLPPADGRWRVEGSVVVCDAPSGVTRVPDDDVGPYTVYSCGWLNVSLAGRNHCQVIVTYRRASTSDPWPEPTVFGTTADCTTD
jgi:hypothetical protein